MNGSSVTAVDGRSLLGHSLLGHQTSGASRLLVKTVGSSFSQSNLSDSWRAVTWRTASFWWSGWTEMTIWCGWLCSNVNDHQLWCQWLFTMVQMTLQRTVNHISANDLALYSKWLWLHSQWLLPPSQWLKLHTYLWVSNACSLHTGRLDQLSSGQHCASS